MNQYFVKLGNDVEGPLSESELRERLSAQRIPSNALIKQGHNGGEFTTDYVKRIFDLLDQQGWYVRGDDGTSGPFVDSKIQSMLYLVVTWSAIWI